MMQSTITLKGTPDGAKIRIEHSDDDAATPEYFIFLARIVIDNGLDNPAPCPCSACLAATATLKKLKEALGDSNGTS